MTVDLSVIVPTYNRPQQLDRCLAALARQDLEGTFEVIVVDDGGDVPVQPIVDRYAGTVPFITARQDNTGPAAARNAGAARASGRYLAFTDDDCAPEPGWLSALCTALEHDVRAVVAGRTVNALVDNVFAEASQSLLSYLDRAGRCRNGDLAFAASNNLAVEAARFHRIGGFDASFPLAASEDRDFCDRSRLAGGSLRRAHDAVVHHHHQMGLGGFWRQHVRYGRGARHYHGVRASRGQPRLVVESPGFYVAMLRYPLGHDRTRHRGRCATLIGLSQVATAAGFVAEGGARLARRVSAR